MSADLGGFALFVLVPKATRMNRTPINSKSEAKARQKCSGQAVIQVRLKLCAELKIVGAMIEASGSRLAGA